LADLVVDLREAVAKGEGLSLVAEADDGVVGHVRFAPNLLDAPRRLVPVQVLSPVGVSPVWQ
jgi:putative acetyltransferase